MCGYEYGKCSSCEYEKKPKDELPCRVCTHSCCKWTRKSTDKLERAIGYLNDIGWMQEHDKELTENAVPVVRCKDCRNWSEMQNSTGACLRHSVIDGSWWTGTDSTDYCSFAERRNDESVDS